MQVYTNYVTHIDYTFPELRHHCENKYATNNVKTWF